MTFRVGQKVVCISGPVRGGPPINEPVIGRTYTIAWLDAGDELGYAIGLHEIRNRQHPSGGEYSFYASRFRPIVERKTDISIFTAMLNPSKRSVDA